MRYSSPEQAGISSESIQKYIELLEKKRLASHSLIIAKGDSVVFEQYWKPFDKDFLHRMYSVSKSFVSIAIGFLEQDGVLSLDDPMEKYFAKELKNQPDENMHKQTVRDMLQMSTAKPCRYWFDCRPKDRVAHYFENDLEETRPAGTIYEYDSGGSFVLCALAERLTGKPLMTYLREKLFDKIGVSEEAYCLKCPGGHSWADSGILCKSTDLLKVARFVMNKGKWNGEQLLNEDYVTRATSCAVFNNYWDIEDYNAQGYGYQFWGMYKDAFAFVGMGTQIAVCVPEKDLILVYTSDNQGRESARTFVVDQFFDCIVNTASDIELPPNEAALAKLQKGAQSAELIAASGAESAAFEQEINGVTYKLDKNPMGMKWLRLSFDNQGGTFEYENAQGEKKIPFGRCKNVFCAFPQEGYSDEIGTVPTVGMYYKCASSAAWVEPKKLYIKVQIIDKYFGNLGITLGFKDDVCGVYMNKSAEDFLKEYQGFAGGKRV